MQTTKKKPNILLIVLGAVLASYLGYLVAGAWREGIEFNAFLERFEMVCAYPLNRRSEGCFLSIGQEDGNRSKLNKSKVERSTLL